MASIAKKDKFKTIMLVLAWWFFLAILHLMLLFIAGDFSIRSAQSLLALAALSLIASLAVGNAITFYSPDKQRWMAVALYILSITVLGIGAQYLLTKQFRMAQIPTYLRVQAHLILFFGVSISAIFTRLRTYTENQEEAEQKRRESESLLKEAELHELRLQLQPHFLFNSLNSIYALIPKDPEAGRNMVMLLSRFLRGTVRKINTQHTLSEELEQVKLYLEIERVRFGKRLMIHFELDEQWNALQVPSLISQALVENAIKHGLYATTDALEISIRTYRLDDLLHLEIKNPCSSEPRIQGGTGFGLRSVSRRMQLVYGRSDLHHSVEENGTYLSTLKFPIPHDRINH